MQIPAYFQLLANLALLVLIGGVAWGGYRSGRRQADLQVAKSARLEALVERYQINREDADFLHLLLLNEAGMYTAQEQEKRGGILLYATLISGVLALITLTYVYWTRVVDLLRLTGSLIASPAYAASQDAAVRGQLSWVMPWLLLMVLVVMAIAFLGSIVVLLTGKDTP